jgi:hypothetical protein
MNKLTVVKDQRVAVFGNNGHFQGFYKVESVSAKGTKIVVTREGDGYARTFNGNNIEKNSYSTRFNTAYIRTDIDIVNKQQESQKIAVDIVKEMNNTSFKFPDRMLNSYNKETYETIVKNAEDQLLEVTKRIAEIKTLIAKMPI